MDARAVPHAGAWAEPALLVPRTAHSQRVGHRINGRANQNGQATFRVVGFAANQGASPGSIGPSLRVYVGNAIPPAGVYIGTVRVAALDQNGGGVNGMDLSLFLADYFSGQNYARSDYNGDDVVGANDFSLWLAAFFAGGSAVSGGTPCP